MKPSTGEQQYLGALERLHPGSLTIQGKEPSAMNDRISHFGRLRRMCIACEYFLRCCFWNGDPLMWILQLEIRWMQMRAEIRLSTINTRRKIRCSESRFGRFLDEIFTAHNQQHVGRKNKLKL